MRMMYYSVSDRHTRKNEIRDLSTGDLPITSSDGLPLSHRRLAGAKARKLGPLEKHPVYC